MLAGQSPKDDYSTVHADTTPTCTRADAHVSRAHIVVHSSLINRHALAQGTRDQCRAFLKNIVMPSSCPCQVCLSLVPFLSLHLLLVLCHYLQRHRHHCRGPDQLPAPLLTGVEYLAAWPIQLHTHKDESGVQEMTNPDQAAKNRKVVGERGVRSLRAEELTFLH